MNSQTSVPNIENNEKNSLKGLDLY